MTSIMRKHPMEQTIRNAGILRPFDQILRIRDSEDGSALYGYPIWEVTVETESEYRGTLYVDASGELEWDVSGWPPDFQDPRGVGS